MGRIGRSTVVKRGTGKVNRALGGAERALGYTGRHWEGQGSGASAEAGASRMTTSSM